MLFLRKHATLGMQVSVLREPMACSRRTVGPNVKNPPKMQSKKIVKLTDHTYASQQFDKFLLRRVCNNWKRKSHESVEICLEVILFWACFSYL